ncbi:MAG: protoporphyrinogen oxidase [Pirellulales bacterium]|nr:protoporphyrinogen oxidase [Pirellulales bacterium]
MSASIDRPSNRIAVIGGGITGLTAAWHLCRRDPTAQIVLYESANRPGGVLQTERHDGYCLELGPDSFLRRLPWAVKLCEQLGIAGELTPTEPASAGVYTVYRGRLVRMPEGLAAMAPQRIWPMIRTPILTPWGKVRMAAERLLPARRESDDESLAQFARRRFGAEGLARIIQPLAGGIYMGDPERLSMRAAFPQLVAAERECGSLIKSCRIAARRAAKVPPAPRDTVFTAPRGGIGQLVGALVAALPAECIRLNHRVETLVRDRSGWRIVGVDASTGRAFDERFARVLIAAPAREAATMLRGADENLADVLAGVPTTSCVVVNVAYPCAAIGRPLDAAGIVIPYVEGRLLAACTFSSVKYAGRAPAGAALLRAFLGGAQRPEAVDASDAELVDVVCRELADLLDVRGEPLLVRIARWRHVMPQYHVGHLDRIAEIESRTALLPGLELAGNSYRGIGIPHCIHDAQQAVERLLATSAPPLSRAEASADAPHAASPA